MLTFSLEEGLQEQCMEGVAAITVVTGMYLGEVVNKIPTNHINESICN